MHRARSYHPFLFFLLLCSMLFVRPAYESRAQSEVGRWTLGLRGGVNVMLNDFNRRKPGPGGEFLVRYGLSRSFSLGVSTGFEELKSKQEPWLPGFGFDYLKLNAIPVALAGWLRLLPSESLSPYVSVGAGFLFYQRIAGAGVYVPDEDYLTSVFFPLSAGLELRLVPRTTFVVEAGYRLMSDDVETLEEGSLDGFPTLKLGVDFALGTGDDDDTDGDGISNGEESRRGTNPEVPDTDGDGLTDGEELLTYFSNPLHNDTDGDGLSDGEEVHRHGTRPSDADTDGDGLADGEEILSFRTNPLKDDTDGDGLGDGEEVSKWKSSPVMTDTDGDGLSDRDEVKVFRSNPAAVDSDGDGVADGKEVNDHRSDPANADTDGGGVKDGEEIRQGSNPLNPRDDVFRAPLRLQIGTSVLLDGIAFEAGSATLTRDSEPTLERLLLALVSQPRIMVEVTGYTDNLGTPEHNDRLSQRRADAVKGWLVRKGIAARRITAAGKGMRDPIASNASPEGRARNRRIEVKLIP